MERHRFCHPLEVPCLLEGCPAFAHELSAGALGGVGLYSVGVLSAHVYPALVKFSVALGEAPVEP